MTDVERAFSLDEALKTVAYHKALSDERGLSDDMTILVLDDARISQSARIAALEAENSSLRIHVAALKADADDDYRDLLKAILDLDHERETIGGGPGWQERRKKAYREAWERFE